LDDRHAVVGAQAQRKAARFDRARRGPAVKEQLGTVTLPNDRRVVEIIAPTTPAETIQLQSMPRTNSVSMPPAPCAA
jgi:hypothetical protein